MKDYMAPVILICGGLIFTGCFGAYIGSEEIKYKAIQAGVAEYRLVTNNSSRVEFVFKQKIVFYNTGLNYTNNGLMNLKTNEP